MIQVLRYLTVSFKISVEPRVGSDAGEAGPGLIRMRNGKS